MYLGYENIAVSNTVLDWSDLTVDPDATHAELRAETNTIRYTMDNATTPTTAGVGVPMLVADPPKSFLIDDLRRIKFIRNDTTDAVLHVHYFGPREIT